MGCGSGGDDVNNLFDIDGPTTPVDKDLSIAITKPSANGTPTGHSKTLRGTCGTGGVTIRVDVGGVTGAAFTACAVDETWEVDVDTSTQLIGTITISARMVDGEIIGSPASVTVNKLGTECDSAAARADTFANSSTTMAPPWIVCTSLQLSNIGTTYQNDDITLGNDISFGGGNYASQGGTGGGTDGGYQATFEGRGFEIADFTINASTATQQGLFRETRNSTFQNIVFENISINARYYIGVLAGYVENGTVNISNITANNITLNTQDTGNNGFAGVLFGRARSGASNVTASDITITNLNMPGYKDYKGGLIGYWDNITGTLDIDRVSVTGGDIQVRTHGGGLIGYMHPTPSDLNFTINDVYNTANITCTNGNCGGIVGYANVRIQNAYNSGAISGLGGNSYGGIVGQFRDGFLQGTSAAATREAVTPPAIPTSDPPTVDVNGTPVSCYNTGSVTAAGSQYVGGVVGLTYRDVDNITSCYNTGEVNGGVNYVGGLTGYAELTPVTDSFNVGNVTGSENYVGGLIGYVAAVAPYVQITNSYVGANVTTTGVSPSYVGGLVGRFRSNQAITNVWYNGTITSEGGDDTGRVEYFGGLFGWAEYDGSCTNCHSAGSMSIVVLGTGQDHRYFGGLNGYNRQNIDQSSSSMSITTSEGRYVGGLIGFDYRNSVTNSYATGAQTGRRMVGGLIGQTQDQNGVIEDSYATGNVTANIGAGDCYAGGLVGASGAHVRRSYASGDVTALDCNYVGGLEGGRASNYNRDILQSFATGDVDAGTGRYVGGLAGRVRAYSDRFVDNFATGNVRGGQSVGGLFGRVRRNSGGNPGVRRNYAYGQVVRATGGAGADSSFGPLIGEFNNGTTSTENGTNYYNSDFMPMDEATSLPIGAPLLTNQTPLTSAQMTVPGNFAGFDFGTPVWEMPSGLLVLPGQAFFYTYPVPDWIE